MVFKNAKVESINDIKFESFGSTNDEKLRQERAECLVHTVDGDVFRVQLYFPEASLFEHSAEQLKESMMNAVNELFA